MTPTQRYDPCDAAKATLPSYEGTEVIQYVQNGKKRYVLCEQGRIYNQVLVGCLKTVSHVYLDVLRKTPITFLKAADNTVWIRIGTS